MKFNYKKIASVLASAIMLSSTVGFAAAASVYPAPFVAGGTADGAVIVGADAAPSDWALAIDVGQKLSALVTSTSSGSTVSASGGDSVEISKSATKLNLGDGFSTVWGTALTNSDLKTLLADGKYYNKQNTEYKYNQKVDLGNLTFSHFADSDYKDRLPTLGFQIASNTFIANYTLDFITDPEATHGTDLTDFENKNIVILGKNYYILDFKNSTAKMILLDSASTDSLNEGESKTVTVGDKEYTVSIAFITTDQVILTVDGVNTDKLSATGTTYGNTYKLPDGTYVGIKNINVQDYAGGIKSVEFSIGKGKLEITDSSNIKINDKSITDLYGYITLSNSGSKRTWQKLVIRWQVEDEHFLTPNTELLMPGFEAIKVTMGDTTIPDKEITEVTASNEYLEVKAPLKRGTATIPLLYISTTTGNVSGIGRSITQKLATANSTELIYNATSGPTQFEGFIASWASTREAESYYLKATVRYDSDGVRNLTTITDKITSDILCEDLVAAQTCTIGNVVLTMNKIDYTSGGERTINMTVNTAGGFKNLYTKDGLKIILPAPALVNNDTTPGAINLSGNPSIGSALTGFDSNQWQLFLYEADKDHTLGAKVFNMTIDDTGTSTKYITVSDVSGDGTAYETPTSGSKIWESYVVSELATKILHDKTSSNQNSADVEYHGGEVYANVFVAAPSTVVAGSGTGTIGSGGQVLVVKDKSVDSVSDKNLFVVGGSCINEVAAKILGATAPACGADFTNLAKVSAGGYIIKTVESPYNAAKVATLVAGYNADDTSLAVAQALTGVATDKDTTITYPQVTAQ